MFKYSMEQKKTVNQNFLVNNCWELVRIFNFSKSICQNNTFNYFYQLLHMLFPIVIAIRKTMIFRKCDLLRSENKNLYHKDWVENRHSHTIRITESRTLWRRNRLRWMVWIILRDPCNHAMAKRLPGWVDIWHAARSHSMIWVLCCIRAGYLWVVLGYDEGIYWNNSVVKERVISHPIRTTSWERDRATQFDRIDG